MYDLCRVGTIVMGAQGGQTRIERQPVTAEVAHSKNSHL